MKLSILFLLIFPLTLSAITKDNLATVIDKLITIESSGNCNAIGDNGKAVGCLQIHPIMVRDVNRISGKSYTLQDRYSKAKSVEMAIIYFNHYCRDDCEMELVRKWNGGPSGHKKQATVKYWNKYLSLR